MVLGGIDIGTSGCKCTLMQEDGTMISSCYQEYMASRTAKSHEMKAETIWEAVLTVIKGACEKTPEPVAVLCVSSFGESCVLLDEAGEPLAPILLYTDPRGGEQCGQLEEALGSRQIYRLSGHRLSPMYCLPKLLWYRQNQPVLFEKIAKILPIASFVIYRLCGVFGTDPSLASRTMLLDVRTRDWSSILLKAAGLDAKQLPSVVEAGTTVGKILPEMAKALSLSPSVQIVAGCHDQIAAAIGAGALKAGRAVNGSGTVECVTPMFDTIPDSSVLFDGGYAIVPAPNGLYATYAFIFTGGALLSWYRDNFAMMLKQRALEEEKSIYRLLDESVRSGPSGLLVLPHFAGAATPYMDTEAKGAIYGLSIEQDAADVYRGLLEGICYEMRLNLALLASAGIHIDSLRATGGGARSAVWLQIKADILETPIDTLNVEEAGTVGSILLAGLAAGTYPSLEDAMQITKVRSHLTPKDSSAYLPFYQKYKRLYAALKQLEIME